MLGDRRNSYLTVVVVWTVSSFGLALAISFPIFPVVLLLAVLFLGLVIVGYLLYTTKNRDQEKRALGKNLFPSFRRFITKIIDDFDVVFTHVSVWWLERDAQIQEEMAEEHERRVRKREKLTQWKQKRRAQPPNEHPPTGSTQTYQQGRRRNEPTL